MLPIQDCRAKAIVGKPRSRLQESVLCELEVEEDSVGSIIALTGADFIGMVQSCPETLLSAPSNKPLHSHSQFPEA